MGISWSNYVNMRLFLSMGISGEDCLSVHKVSEMLVGILGGGQLGQMLCQAASQIGIKVLTLDPLENYPTSSLSHQHIVGNFNDGSAVLEFAKRCS
ncbi:phosphoribosylaminoimidazole carboxylase, chloroplastic-like [Asparagus officinalis]|uniref:phosphoribosylaminoimidazole carboxylase, chloroplastic-like n=1 Tax=Asparagus officinalis TaxID=4686 RepID=UPI00098E787F|nr:phosphoribosylaminoimidazole carboxylase, chloroplastic-like [Asparagus officinalis]